MGGGDTFAAEGVGRGDIGRAVGTGDGIDTGGGATGAGGWGGCGRAGLGLSYEVPWTLAGARSFTGSKLGEGALRRGRGLVTDAVGVAATAGSGRTAGSAYRLGKGSMARLPIPASVAAEVSLSASRSRRSGSGDSGSRARRGRGAGSENPS